jgi:hypothetical protein
MYIRAAIAVTACMSLSGCAAPLVRPNGIVMQSKVEHASDWQRLARNSAVAFKGTLHTDPPKIYVAPGPSDMPFATAYKKYMEGELLRLGYPVVQSAVGAVVLNFDVQTYWYGGFTGNQKRLVEYASFYTTIGSAIAEMRHMNSPETKIAKALAAGPIVDILASLNDTTRSEVILTLTVSDESRVHYMATDTFYIQPSDIPLYMTQMPASVPQAMQAAPLTVVPLRVTSN